MNNGTGQSLQNSAKVLLLDDYREKRLNAESEERRAGQNPSTPWPTSIAWVPVFWMPVVLWPSTQSETPSRK